MTDKARAAIVPLVGLATLGLVLQAALLLFGSAESSLPGDLLVALVVMASAVALLAAATRAPGTRAPWLILGLGIFSYGIGLAFYVFVAAAGPESFPQPTDLFRLAFYACILAAIFLSLRRHRRTDRLTISLDAAIIALAIGAVAYKLIFGTVIDVSRAADAVGGQIAYSVIDFAILVMLVIVCAPSRAKVGRAYLALGAGMLLIFASDFLFVRDLSSGAVVPSTLPQLGLPLGMLVIALAALQGTSLESVNALRGRSLLGGIVLAFVASVGLLISEALSEGNPVVIVLAVAAPCLIMIRLLASVREADRLATDNVGIINAAGEGIFRSDLGGRLSYANPAALKMLGYSADQVLGRHVHATFHHTRANGMPYAVSDCPAGKSLTKGLTLRVTDEVFWRKDGSSFAVDYTCTPIREGGRIAGAVTVFDDVTSQHQMKEQLRHQADHDSLTGLFNRRRFEAEVSGQIEYAQRYARPGALLLMDLDTFKFVNDSYGHPIGDRLLVDVGASLSATVRSTDVVARIGGDEFAVLLREAEEEEAMAVSKKLIAAIRTGSKPSIGASIGVAPFDGRGEKTPDELLVAADIALYEAKEMGGGTTVLNTGQRSQALTWVERIRGALEEDRLVVYAQPIVDLETGATAREELLVRMVDANGDKIPPASFLPAAERFGLIHEIDLLVLSKAIELVKRGTPVAVNVSVRTLTDPRYLAALEQALAAGAAPAHFNFEITETAAVANMSDAQEFARRIRELGCSLSLDDFGTGFSSFTYLKHIPAQYLKIDIEFIRELEKNPADQRLVAAIVSIAHGLGQMTVAEGVEDAETLATVRRLGVDYAQGFHLGGPEPTESDIGPGSRSVPQVPAA